MQDPTPEPQRSASQITAVVSGRCLERNIAKTTVMNRLFGTRSSQTQLDRFYVLGRIGQGGMGTVYAGHDPRLDRPVAIKVVRNCDHDDEYAQTVRLSLEREARIAASLAHPNIITIYDSGELGDGFFIVMELVRGRTLREWLEDESPSWPEIVEMFVDIGRGLEAVHDAGLVHGDFKPDNVLVGDNGRPRLTDFGLATKSKNRPSSSIRLTTVAPSDSQSSCFDVAGTPSYMSPEQRRGATMSPKSDQFSYCVVLYQALFGRLPYHRSNDAELEDPGTLRRAHVGAKIPRSLTRTLLTGLSLNIRHRHRSMRDLVRSLEDLLERHRHRHRTLIEATVLAVGTGLGIAGLLSMAA